MRDKVLTFLNIAQMDKIIDERAAKLVDQFRDGFQGGFGESLPPEAEKALAAVRSALAARRSDLVDRLAAVYEKHYTAAQMDDIIAFYGTDAGKRMTETGATITQETGEIANAWENEVLRDPAIESELRNLLGEPPAQVQAAELPQQAAELPAPSAT